MSDWKSQERERLKEQMAGHSLSLAVGINTVRILPDKKDLTPDGKVSPKGILHKPCREVRVHFGIGPDEAILPCGKNEDGMGPCWLCDVKIPELEASGDAKKAAIAERLTAKNQFIVNASRIDPDTQKFALPKPWKMVLGGQLSLGIRIKSRILNGKKDIIDPVKGYNINVTATGEGMKRRYPEIDTDDAPTSAPAAILAAVKSLDSLISAYDEEDQKSAYFGRPRRDEVEAEAEAEAEVLVDDEAENTSEEDTAVADEVLSEGVEPDQEEYAADPEPEQEEYVVEEAEPEPEDEPAPPPPPRRPVPAPVRKPVPAPAGRTAAPPAKKSTPAPAPPPRRR